MSTTTTTWDIGDALAHLGFERDDPGGEYARALDLAGAEALRAAADALDSGNRAAYAEAAARIARWHARRARYDKATGRR